MAQLERPQRHVVEQTSRAPTINTMEQLLRAGESSKPKQSPTFSSSKQSPTFSSSKPSPTFSPTSSPTSSSSSPFFQRLRHQDSATEEDQGQNQKKSVLTKVKEKAKKLRHSLSKKKDGNVTSPLSGANLEGGGAEEDAEYIGAPMYESEEAPARQKENARQHQRPSPIIPEKHVMSNNDKPGGEQDTEKSQYREKSLNRCYSMSKRTTQNTTTPTTAPAAAAAAPTALSDPNKTMNKTVAEKLTPTYVEGSEAANSITSKIQDLAVSIPAKHNASSSSMAAPATITHINTSLSLGAPRTPPAKLPSQTSSSVPRISTPSSAPVSGKNTSPSSQIWDKGVSMKEYLMNKFEPGEDEKALSRVISEAMSPRRTPGDAGVMEKVREAVTSLLRNEEPTKYVDPKTAPTTHTSLLQNEEPTKYVDAKTAPTTHTSLLRNEEPTKYVDAKAAPTTHPSLLRNEEPTKYVDAKAAPTTHTSSQLPVSQEVVQDENHGKILQAN